LPYRVVLFDVGDTLIQVPRPAPTYQRLLAQHGCDLDVPRIEAILGEARRLQDEHYPNWLAEDLTLDPEHTAGRRHVHVDTILRLAAVPDCDTARQAFFDLYVSTELFTLFPDAAPTLACLRAGGYRLGIVSNWEPRLRLLCAAHGIDEYFDFAVISEVEGYFKPHPRLYERALELAGVPPEDVVHVGDKMREDVEGATAVGISAILLDRTGSLETAHRPRITSLHELPEVLAR
jgi:putative hydrolase of the HAD superfamily